jgi:hypothetical protein
MLRNEYAALTSLLGAGENRKSVAAQVQHANTAGADLAGQQEILPFPVVVVSQEGSEDL